MIRNKGCRYRNLGTRKLFPGLAEGMVDISPLSKNVTLGTAETIELAKVKILGGWNVFSGPLWSNDGRQILLENEALSDGDITSGVMTSLLIKGVEVK